jgi:hypothetical protein
MILTKRRESIFVLVFASQPLVALTGQAFCVLRRVLYHSISDMQQSSSVKNLIAKAIVERILRAARDRQRFKVRSPHTACPSA